MSDIVERLRELADNDGCGVIQDIVELLHSAADEIWHLKVECGIKDNDIEELQIQIQRLHKFIEDSRAMT